MPLSQESVVCWKNRTRLMENWFLKVNILVILISFHPIHSIRDLTQTATAKRTSLNERFNEEVQWPCTCVIILVHFLAVLYKPTTWNDQIFRFVENVKHTANFSSFCLELSAIFTYSAEDSSGTDRKTEWPLNYRDIRKKNINSFLNRSSPRRRRRGCVKTRLHRRFLIRFLSRNFCRARARDENRKCKLAAIWARFVAQHVRNPCDIAATKVARQKSHQKSPV